MTSGRRHSAFTLVEVLVATAVLAIGLLAALSAFSMAARISGVATRATTISFLAQEKLAEIQSLGPRHLRPGATTGSFAPAHSDYLWSLSVRQPDKDNVVRVDLVIYPPQPGKKRGFRFTTAVF